MDRRSRTKAVAAAGIVIMMIAVSASAFITIDDEGGIAPPETSEALNISAADLFLLLTIGPIGYAVYNYLGGASGTDAGELRASAAENLRSYINTPLNHAALFSQDEKTLIGFTQSFFERMGELAAAQQWSLGGTIDFDSILIESRALEEYAKLMLNRMNIVNSTFRDVKDKVSEWFGQSVYGSMNIALSYGLTNVVSNGTTLVEYCLGTTITSSTANKIYLYNGGETKSGFLYASAASTMTSASGQSYNLVSGYNSLGEIPNGIYTMQTGRSYFGSMMETYSTGYAEVYPAAAMTAGSQTFYVMDTDTGMKAIRNNISTSITATEYRILYDSQYKSVDLTIGLDFISNIYNASNLVFSRALNAATAAWYVFDTAGASSILVSPSMLIPNLENMDFTADQIFLIYMSALQQASPFFTAASGNFTAADVKISEDSLDMICQGTIFTNSAMTSAVQTGYFTPMCFLRDQAVIVGNTAFMQPGLVMFWQKQPDGSYRSDGLVILESGNYLKISMIEYRGQTYTEYGAGVTLRVTSLPDLEGFDGSGTHDPKPGGGRGGLSIAVILIIAGLVMLVIGFGADESWIKGIGALLAIIGAAWFFFFGG